MPFNSGTIFLGLVIAAAFYFVLKYTRKKEFPLINSAILCVLFIFIGFSCWIMLPIRANAGTVINENNPNNARELLAYYNLEQYPETHLFYGPQFTEIYAGLDEDNPYDDDKPKYEKNIKTGKSGPIKFTVKPEYQDQSELLEAVTQFRREYAVGKMDNDDYNKFLRSFGDYLNVEKPSFASNVMYLIEYQMGYMYWRYFMWNFVGRQDGSVELNL